MNVNVEDRYLHFLARADEEAKPKNIIRRSQGFLVHHPHMCWKKLNVRSIVSAFSIPRCIHSQCSSIQEMY